MAEYFHKYVEGLKKEKKNTDDEKTRKSISRYKENDTLGL
jgi:hypothetical protein